MDQDESEYLTQVRQRLLELAQDRRVSLSSLSDLIGRNKTYLQQFIRKGSPRKLEEQDRRKLAQFFGVAESELGAAQNALPATATNMAGDWVGVPRLDVGASAEQGALAGDEAGFDTFRFSRRWLREQGLGDAQLSAITVEGDAMEPLLRDGDEILVDVTPRTFRDGIHVVRFDDTLMVKRVANSGQGRLSLISQNLAYPPLDLPADQVEVIGRVVWKGGRL